MLNAQRIDARGRSCPEPVLMAKKGLSGQPGSLEVMVDNTTAVENVSRFGRSSGYTVTVERADSDYILKLNR